MGVSPLFPPKHPDEQEARLALLHTVRRRPDLFGYQRSRWTLAMLLETCSWLQLGSQPGLWQLLKRLHISYKRGRPYVHSPDRAYQDKLKLVEQYRLRAYYAPQRYAFWYLDEFTFFRQPTVACAYEAQGHHQPLARQSHRSNTRWRTVGALNVLTGQVLHQSQSKIDLACLSNFFAAIHAANPDLETTYVVLDNWPVHFHPDVLARLQPQHLPYPPRLPANWPTEPSAKAIVDELPIQLVCLPTYASWLNPIEKLWLWLRQDVLHLHRLCDDWPALKQRVEAFLAQFRNGSNDLLHYVGLLPN